MVFLKEVKGRCGDFADPAAVTVVAVGLVFRGNSGHRVDMVAGALAQADDDEVGTAVAVPVDGGGGAFRPRTGVEVRTVHVDGVSGLAVGRRSTCEGKGDDGLVGVVAKTDYYFVDSVAVEVGRG